MFEIRMFPNDDVVTFATVQECSTYLSTRMRERAVELRRDYFESSWELTDLIDWLADGQFEDLTANDVLEDALELIKDIYEDGVYDADRWYLGFIRWVFEEE